MKHKLFFFLTNFLVAAICFSQGTILKYTSDTSKLAGYYAPSKKKNAPGVVIIPAWMGITDHEKKSANDLAAQGYNTLVADIYGENIHPANGKEASALSGFYKKNYIVYQARIRSAIETLQKQGTNADNLVVMGYCFGGTGALEAARGELPVKGVVSFHGGLGKDSTRKNEPVTAKVLVLHGADDPFVPEKDIKKFQQEMRDSKADWQMIYYSNAVHAFTDPAAGNDNSKGAAYNKTADERSWKAMLEFLKETIK